MRGWIFMAAAGLTLAAPGAATARPGERDVTFPVVDGFPGLSSSYEPDAMGVLPGNRVAVAVGTLAANNVRVAVVRPDGRVERRFGIARVPRARATGIPVGVA